MMFASTSSGADFRPARCPLRGTCGLAPRVGITFSPEPCDLHTLLLLSRQQFYVLSPAFIVLYMRRRLWGLSVTFLAIVASTAAMAIGTYLRGWSALTLDGSWVIKYSEETYTTPYFRIVSYLIGMFFAMLWHEKQARDMRFFRLHAWA